ncbi:hypothetical protein SAMN05444287_1530 [Octadecabacter temperatus]|uniref:Uncharacterized protein n=1 Tax=Octadecabacter temperatus TaxID=1458307 RepID=A0A0K0Y627_9RHOB|nr:hypothetical protein OSB_18740 [Octadecabacter temperatus]SIO13554.1 hypothetical protein SAMN05444287_1530 [Octadecabacter temperatus]
MKATCNKSNWPPTDCLQLDGNFCFFGKAAIGTVVMNGRKVRKADRGAMRCVGGVRASIGTLVDVGYGGAKRTVRIRIEP